MKPIFSYNNLWKLLIDNGMQKKDLTEKLGISSSTIAKMGKNLPVTLDTIAKLCAFFTCNIGDIIEIKFEGATK